MELPTRLTFEALEAYAKEHFNEVVIDLLSVCRFVGVLQTDEDFYYTVKYPNGPRKGICHLSCVGSLTLLKGVIPERDYNMMDNILRLNGAEPEPEVIIKTETESRF